jgi:hypothetical protein
MLLQDSLPSKVLHCVANSSSRFSRFCSRTFTASFPVFISPSSEARIARMHSYLAKSDLGRFSLLGNFEQ